MKTMKTVCIGFLALLAFHADASGATLIFNGTLSGAAEAPANASPGTGSVSLQVDSITFVWTLAGNYSNLIGTVSAAHVHGPALPGVNAGVTAGGALAQTGGTSGTLSGGGTFTSTQFNDLNSGLFYVNVHTNSFPGGEVRAQLVPEPSAAGMIGLASILVCFRRRGRRRA